MLSAAIPTLRPLAGAGILLLGLGAGAPAQTPPRLDVPFVPTPQQVVERMLQMAEVKSTDFVIDLGSGDGRIVITAAKKYGARGLGVDLNPERVREARANAEREGVTDKVEFRVQNLFETDISPADVLTMYLLSTVNLQLKPRLLSDLRPGTRIVSHAFDLGDWQPDASDSVDGRQVFFWVVPAKVEGRWQVQHNGQSFLVDLKQTYQKLSGSVDMGGRTMPLKGGEVRGTQISFTIDAPGAAQSFRGQVVGDRIEPAAGSTPTWSATRVR
jgi:hypothetical protein